jgi:archaellum component FlaC
MRSGINIAEKQQAIRKEITVVATQISEVKTIIGNINDQSVRVDNNIRNINSLVNQIGDRINRVGNGKKGITGNSNTGDIKNNTLK